MVRLTGSRDRLGFALCLSTGTATTATATAAPPIDPPVHPGRWVMVAMALTSADTSLPLTALFAVLLAFWTTAREVAADAWHIELSPTQDRQGQIVVVNLWRYRMAMVAAGSGGLPATPRCRRCCAWAGRPARR